MKLELAAIVSLGLWMLDAQGVYTVFLCIGAATLYGVLHDQITARVCVEYFTVGHPPIFNTDDPTLLGLGWGILATWWVGLLLGVPLALAARVGHRPQRSVRSLIRPVAELLVIMAVGATAAGLLGGLLASQGVISLAGSLAQELPPSKHVPFLVDLWAHSASYLLGFIGGIVVIVQVWRSRAVV